MVNMEDLELKLYVITGCLGVIILIIFALIIHIFIQTKRLDVDVQVLKRDQTVTQSFMKPKIQPNEELSKRGFSMYTAWLWL